jgi:glycerol-3-phosphate acyltransferase PlsY
MWQTYLTVALVAYLLGSIPFGYILVKLFLKQDIRTTGSGNIGATNVARSGKKGLAIATLLLDAGKGWLAVVLCLNYLLKFNLYPESLAAFDYRPIYLAIPHFWTLYSPLSVPKSALPLPFEQVFFIPLFSSALFAILGHCFPVWLRFKGGKGVATAAGAFLVISPIALGISFATFVVVFLLTRIVSLGSIFAAGVFAIYFWRRFGLYGLWEMAIPATLASTVIIVKHHSNIRRLLNGAEPKFGLKKTIPADPIQVEKNA